MDDQVNQEIMIDFEGFDFKPNDFYSVKLLLSNYLEGSEVVHLLSLISSSMQPKLLI